MTGVRKAVREATMATVLTFIIENPGSTVTKVSDGTGVPNTEVSRLLRPEKYEFRTEEFIMNLRKKNFKYYVKLISDGQWTVRGKRRGMIINTSKREMFDRFCCKMGYNLTTDSRGRAFAISFQGDSNETTKTLRVKECATLPKTDDESE